MPLQSIINCFYYLQEHAVKVVNAKLITSTSHEVAVFLNPLMKKLAPLVSDHEAQQIRKTVQELLSDVSASSSEPKSTNNTRKFNNPTGDRSQP